MDGSVWFPALGAVAVVGALSGVGAIVLFLQRNRLERLLLFMISFAAGALLGDSVFHLIPEAAESEWGFDITASYALIGGILSFFILEKVLHWHHAHFPSEEVVHPVAISNLVGDGLHNFLDGAIVAGSFVVSTELGVATAIAVALHEIPQELGDFSILVHAGMKPKKALLLNLGTGMIALLGAVAALSFASVGDLERYLVPFSAGAFIYIASTDLIPELHKEPEPVKSLLQVLALGAGVAIMAALLVLE